MGPPRFPTNATPSQHLPARALGTIPKAIADPMKDLSQRVKDVENKLEDQPSKGDLKRAWQKDLSKLRNEVSGWMERETAARQECEETLESMKEEHQDMRNIINALANRRNNETTPTVDATLAHPEPKGLITSEETRDRMINVSGPVAFFDFMTHLRQALTRAMMRRLMNITEHDETTSASVNDAI